MNSSLSNIKPKFITGWKLALFSLKFGVSLGKYLLQRKKYPLFILKEMNLFKKNRMLGIAKIPKFGKQYYTAILRIPPWPSKAYDHMIANGGLNIRSSGTPLKTQIDSVILGISQRCNYKCKHCYEYFNLAEKDSVPVERWKDVIKELQRIGTSIIVLSGGEPMLRYDGLLELLKSSDKNLSNFHVHTSGHGVTEEKACALKKAGLKAAGVALDDFNPDRHDTFRGYPGAYQEALEALNCFREAGIFPYLNICLTKDLIRSRRLWDYIEHAKDLNVGIMNLLEPKPCGRFLSENVEDLFSEEDRDIVTEFFIEANRSKKYKDYPFVAYQHYYEKPELLGCLMGGLSHFYIDSLGNVQPCVFLPISFGNIMEDDFFDIYKRMRKKVPGPLFQQCPSLYFAEKIKAKKNQGMLLPIPYKEIEKEWEEMYAKNPHA